MVKAKWNKITLTPQKANIKYTAGHALAIHQGATYKDNRPDLPASPWVLTTIKETDCPALFVDNYDGDVKRAFALFVEELALKMQSNLAAIRWYHPRDTQRKNGELVKAGLRDRIDTGELYDSQEVTFE
ncbi:MAG: hypothetical protein KME47_09400 [Nodosilinea sp. WJT8-NPBG4]|jgi:hypothetical protein|nr:hypothetical protein [Nodosilinea sp. WJT8-NPBG4]